MQRLGYKCWQYRYYGSPYFGSIAFHTRSIDKTVIELLKEATQDEKQNIIKYIDNIKVGSNRMGTCEPTIHIIENVMFSNSD